MHEIKEVLEHLGFEHTYEEKAYPRDRTQYGRFRVALKDPRTGDCLVEGITSRRVLLLKLGELIPGLKSRKEAKVKPGPSVQGMALPGYPETLIAAAGSLPAALQQRGMQRGKPGAGSDASTSVGSAKSTSVGSAKKKKGR